MSFVIVEIVNMFVTMIGLFHLLQTNTERLSRMCAFSALLEYFHSEQIKPFTRGFITLLKNSMEILLPNVVILILLTAFSVVEL